MEDDGIQKLGFTKTQSVVFELVLLMQNQGQNHVVWMDNLFTTQELRSYLRKHHVGAAGTVRTGRTKRETKETLQTSQTQPSQTQLAIPRLRMKER